LSGLHTGDRTRVELALAKGYFENGEATALFGVAFDITKHKRAEQKLRAGGAGSRPFCCKFQWDRAVRSWLSPRSVRIRFCAVFMPAGTCHRETPKMLALGYRFNPDGRPLERPNILDS
jgi:hypothetical protein